MEKLGKFFEFFEDILGLTSKYDVFVVFGLFILVVLGILMLITKDKIIKIMIVAVFSIMILIAFYIFAIDFKSRNFFKKKEIQKQEKVLPITPEDKKTNNDMSATETPTLK